MNCTNKTAVFSKHMLHNILYIRVKNRENKRLNHESSHILDIGP